uniref:Uncharacterized protein n=1 Tax=Clastoptera arizonana TaxID=38151 RepID=A0A1B6C271_9HEMI
MDLHNKSASVEPAECNITKHEFLINAHDISFKGVVLKMKKSIFLWIGESEDPAFSNLSFAALSMYEKSPIHTTIIDSGNEASCNTLAKQLSNKLKKPVWVSVNVDVKVLDLLESINNEINAHPEQF